VRLDFLVAAVEVLVPRHLEPWGAAEAATQGLPCVVVEAGDLVLMGFDWEALGVQTPFVRLEMGEEPRIEALHRPLELLEAEAEGEARG